MPRTSRADMERAREYGRALGEGKSAPPREFYSMKTQRAIQRWLKASKDEYGRTIFTKTIV
jgi:hypothetical protein